MTGTLAGWVVALALAALLAGTAPSGVGSVERAGASPVATILPASSSGPGNGSAPTSYSVTFIASGLPPGAGWTVKLGSMVENETGLTALFIDVPHGNESFDVVAPSGYSVSPSHGTLSLAKNTSISLDFSPTPGPASPFGPVAPLEAYLIVGLVAFGGASVAVIEWHARRAARRRSP